MREEKKSRAAKNLAKSRHRKVVCVNTAGVRADGYNHPGGLLKKGAVYHVTEVNDRTGGFVILGKPTYSNGVEVGWKFDRFRVIA